LNYIKGKYPQPFKTGQTPCIRRLFESSMEARLKIVALNIFDMHKTEDVQQNEEDCRCKECLLSIKTERWVTDKACTTLLDKGS
jgi:hypothetical protein